MGTDEKLVPGQLLMSGILASHEKKDVMRMMNYQQIQQVVVEPTSRDGIYRSVDKYQNEEKANV